MASRTDTAARTTGTVDGAKPDTAATNTPETGPVAQAEADAIRWAAAGTQSRRKLVTRVGVGLFVMVVVTAQFGSKQYSARAFRIGGGAARLLRSGIEAAGEAAKAAQAWVPLLQKGARR